MSDILFVALHRGNFPTMEYAAEMLSAEGHSVYAVYLSGQPANISRFCVSCGGSWERMEIALKSIPDMPTYVQAHGRGAPLAMLARDCRPGSTVVCEVYDWMKFLVEPRNEKTFIKAGMFTGDEIAGARRAEESILGSGDGFIYKDGGPGVMGMVREAKAVGLHALPCPPAAYFHPPSLSAPSNKLVYTGQTLSHPIPEGLFSFLQMGPVFASLIRQGLDVTMHRSAKCSDASMIECSLLSGRSSSFRIRDWIPAHKIAGTLGRGGYGWGLLLHDFGDEPHMLENHIAEAMPSKVFTYISAGIPVLVSERLTCAADFIRSTGAGIVISDDQMNDVSDIIRSVDRPSILASVSKAQDIYSAERNVPGWKRMLGL